MPKLEATFETLVDAFVFLDKNKDGYVSKSEMVQAINETTSGERSSGRIAMKRFGLFSLSLSISKQQILTDSNTLIQAYKLLHTRSCRSFCRDFYYCKQVLIEIVFRDVSIK